MRYTLAAVLVGTVRQAVAPSRTSASPKAMRKCWTTSSSLPPGTKRSRPAGTSADRLQLRLLHGELDAAAFCISAGTCARHHRPLPQPGDAQAGDCSRRPAGSAQTVSLKVGLLSRGLF